jgi:hypothetical protein
MGSLSVFLLIVSVINGGVVQIKMPQKDLAECEQSSVWVEKHRAQLPFEVIYTECIHSM